MKVTGHQFVMVVVVAASFLGFAMWSAFVMWVVWDDPRGISQEQRVTVEQVNACVDSKPRPCRKLLNRFLAEASPEQRQEIRRAQTQRTRTLASPSVQKAPEPSDEPERDTRPPASTEPLRRSSPPARSPSAPTPSPPDGSARPPEPQPPRDPALPPTTTLPIPPAVCDQLPQLPVCP